MGMMAQHTGMPGMFTTDSEPLCPPGALLEVDRPDLGRGRFVVVCSATLGGCGRQTLPRRRVKAPPARQLVTAGERAKPWADGPAPWAI